MADTDGERRGIDTYYLEDRTFPPPKGFRDASLITDQSLYDDAAEDFEGFWARQAVALDWYDEWETILEWKLPFARWFVGGTLNVSYNCLDRHVEAGRGDRVAHHWEGEPRDTRPYTHADLKAQDRRLAHRPQSPGAEKRDRRTRHLPRSPQPP